MIANDIKQDQNIAGMPLFFTEPAKGIRNIVSPITLLPPSSLKWIVGIYLQYYNSLIYLHTDLRAIYVQTRSNIFYAQPENWKG